MPRLIRGGDRTRELELEPESSRYTGKKRRQSGFDQTPISPIGGDRSRLAIWHANAEICNVQPAGQAGRAVVTSDEIGCESEVPVFEIPELPPKNPARGGSILTYPSNQMNKVTLAILTLSLAIAATSHGHAQTRPSTPAQNRQHIVNTVNRTAQRPITVTSGHRGNSAAHRRGAIDIRSRDIPSPARHTEAAALSRGLGRNHTVVVEEVHSVNRRAGVQGPQAQVNTAYRNGVRGNVRVGPVRASGTHTHIQPDRR